MYRGRLVQRVCRDAGRVLQEAAPGCLCSASTCAEASRLPLSHHRGFATENDNFTSFGYKTVRTEEKEALVRQVFEKVAGKYDLMNDAMSGGMHRVWKDRLVQILRPGPSDVHVDVAGGTGDVAFRVLEAMRRAEKYSLSSSRAQGSVTVCDINPAMLAEGQKKAVAQGVSSEKMKWLEGNAEDLPFEENSVDSYTIVFGLRNCTHIDAVLRCAHRILRPGGRFLCMEFSHVQNPLFRQVYDAYSFYGIPLLGEVLAGDRKSYEYLVESIRKFPQQEVLTDMMTEAGFQNSDYANLMGGAVAIHSGFKL